MKTTRLRVLCLFISVLLLSASFTEAVNCKKFKIHPNTLPNGFLGTAYSQQLTTTGGNAISFSISGGSLPTPLTLSTSGLISGTPDTVGAFSFTVQYQSAACTKTRSYSITINPPGCPPITVTPFTVPDGTVNVSYTQTFGGSGGVAPYTFAVASGTLPAGLTLDPATGIMTGTPTVVGPSAFSITATDANSCVGVQAYTMNINCPAIRLTPSTLPAATTGTAYSQTVSAAGGAEPYTYAVTSGALPGGFSLDANSGLISGTATVAGSYSFSITATDSIACAGTQSYAVDVNPPACTTITLSPSTLPDAPVGAVYNQTITASGGTSPYTFAVTSGALPTGLAMDPSGNITGTPTVTGVSAFTVTATDSNGCTASWAYAINVGCPSFTFTPDTLPSGIVNTPYNQTVTVSGGATPYTFDVIAGSLPLGTVLDPLAGSISGTPVLAGSYSFLFSATDNYDCQDSWLYSIVINPVSCGTITLSPSTLPNAALGGSYSATLTASGGTAPYTFSISGGTPPSGLTLDPASGVLSGTPTATGSFSFNVTATDNNGCLGSAAYTINVSDNCIFCYDFSTFNFDTGYGPFLQKPLNSCDASTGDAVCHATRKADLISPDFGGCTNCSFEAEMSIGTAGGRVSLFGWYQDSKHYVEVRLFGDRNKILIKQRDGLLAAKKKVLMTIATNQFYDVQVSYAGGQFQVVLDGVALPGLTLTSVAAPSGNMKFRVKSTTGALTVGTLASVSVR